MGNDSNPSSQITRPNVCPEWVCSSPAVQTCLMGGPGHCSRHPEGPDHPALKRKLVCLKEHLNNLCYVGQKWPKSYQSELRKDFFPVCRGA